MRLGRVLVERGFVDREKLAVALARQAELGGRLGTNLIELGFADHDQIATALAAIHRVEPALAGDLEGRDPSVVGRVPRLVGYQHFAVPLALRSDGRLLVCLRDPGGREALGEVAAAVGIGIVPCAAAEISIYYLMERCYGIRRAPRFWSSPLAVVKQDAVEEDGWGFARLEVVDLDHDEVMRGGGPASPGAAEVAAVELETEPLSAADVRVAVPPVTTTAPARMSPTRPLAGFSKPATARPSPARSSSSRAAASAPRSCSRWRETSRSARPASAATRRRCRPRRS
jgi:hypothetical protein